MPDAPQTTPAQEGVTDELEAQVIGWDDDQVNLIVQKPGGETVQVTPEGEILPGVEEVEIVDASDPDAEGIPDDYKPPEEALAVDVVDPRDVYRAMDRNDEVMILDELMGRAIAAMVYSFESGGKLQTDLSVGGVNETVRLMNERGGTRLGISPQPPLVEKVEKDGETYYQVMVFALDSRTGAGRWGVATEPENMSLKSGGKKWDKFALTKALNKAQRNALRAHIPEEFRQKVIALALADGNVKKLKPLGAGTTAGGTPLELQGPVIEGPHADRVRAECDGVYKKLKEGFGQLVLPPARYHLLFEEANHDSVERLEAFRDYVQNVLDEQIELAAKKAEAGS